MTARKKRPRPTARVVRPAFPAVPDPSPDTPYVNTAAEELGLTLDKIHELATVISLDFAQDPAIIADCILDQLKTAKALQQDIEGDEAAARARAPQTGAI